MKITLAPGVTLFHADCRDALRSLPDNSVDAVPCDPPYELNFMGKGWDDTGIANDPAFWAEVFRVLKPGGHLAAFSASRTYHRMACAIEDAGFEIRDSLFWCYATGFPKSLNVSKQDAFCQCAEPSFERDVRFMQCTDVSAEIPTGQTSGQVLQSIVPEQNSHEQGSQASTGRISALDGQPQSSMERRSDVSAPEGQLCSSEICSLPAGPDDDGANGRLRDGASLGHGAADRSSVDAGGMCASSRPQAVAQQGNQSRTVAGQSLTQDGGAWENCGRCGKPMVPDGFGTALKPAFEPIVLARKPLSEPTVAANVLKWRTGALNIDGCRIPSEKPTGWGGKAAGGNTWDETNNGLGKNGAARPVEGRWPANVVTDGSDEVVGMFPTAGGQQGRARQGGEKAGSIYGKFASNVTTSPEPRGDSGSAARFFYSAKASKADRNGSKHPTVKPISLIAWLARLITPPGGTILDPFAGSGTTGAAGVAEGFSVILCERENEYVADIKRRLGRFDLDAALASEQEARRLLREMFA